MGVRDAVVSGGACVTMGMAQLSDSHHGHVVVRRKPSGARPGHQNPSRCTQSCKQNQTI